MWKSAIPYISFFIVLLVTVAVLPLCDKQWISCSEMSLVALFFTGNVLLIQPNLSLRTPLQYGQFTWSRENAHTFFVKITSKILWTRILGP